MFGGAPNSDQGLHSERRTVRDERGQQSFRSKYPGRVVVVALRPWRVPRDRAEREQKKIRGRPSSRTDTDALADADHGLQPCLAVREQVGIPLDLGRGRENGDDGRASVREIPLAISTLHRRALLKVRPLNRANEHSTHRDHRDRMRHPAVPACRSPIQQPHISPIRSENLEVRIHGLRVHRVVLALEGLARADDSGADGVVPAVVVGGREAEDGEGGAGREGRVCKGLVVEDVGETPYAKYPWPSPRCTVAPCSKFVH